MWSHRTPFYRWQAPFTTCYGDFEKLWVLVLWLRCLQSDHQNVHFISSFTGRRIPFVISPKKHWFGCFFFFETCFTLPSLTYQCRTVCRWLLKFGTVLMSRWNLRLGNLRCLLSEHLLLGVNNDNVSAPALAASRYVLCDQALDKVYRVNNRNWTNPWYSYNEQSITTGPTQSQGQVIAPNVRTEIGHQD